MLAVICHHYNSIPYLQVPPGMSGGMMSSPQQAMFMQQGVGVGPRGPFPGQNVGLLQGPLAYLEKTTSNIGLGDGRR